ncbi:MAG: hypothetical protein FWD50_07380 [Betaproteobacteria bacterium]|nr:hypothetical protein [Betaproteobacteria bacterium]
MSHTHDFAKSTVTCPECNAATVWFEEGLSAGHRCIACEWCVVTTNHNHPAFDKTTYSVHVAPLGIDRTKLIALLAIELALPIRDARTLVDRANPIAKEINATEVYRLDKKLRPHGIGLSISPAFPWPLP